MFECLAYIYDIKLLLFVFTIYLVYRFGKIKHNLHLKLGHRGPPPLPFIGNMVDLFRLGFHQMDQIHGNKYGKIYPFYFGNIPLTMVSDEELLKQILIKDSNCFTDRMIIFPSGKSTEKFLTSLKGKDWERVRNLVTPTFTSGKLKKMSPLISDGVELLDKRITQHPENKPIDFKEFFGALTMDVIARTMFGIKIDSQTNPNNKFVIHAKKFFAVSFFSPLMMVNLIFPNFIKLFRKLFPNTDLRAGETLEFFNEVMEKAILERKQSSEEYNDFLALMLKAHKEIDGNNSDNHKDSNLNSLTNQEIMAQSLIFLLAGYETTATTLTYIAYFLAKNPTAQQEVFDEIVEKIGIEGELTYESLMNLTSMDGVINETMRICPPVVRTERQCTQDITLVTSDNKKIFAKKGDIFGVPIYAIHKDPSIWPNPDMFDLHRFNPENKKKHRPYSFMPFGMGPRNCVGLRFALVEIKWALVVILRKFEIVTCEETLETIKFQRTGLSAPITPILLKVQKRS